jgi:hypothetical protein
VDPHPAVEPASRLLSPPSRRQIHVVADTVVLVLSHRGAQGITCFRPSPGTSRASSAARICLTCLPGLSHVGRMNCASCNAEVSLAAAERVGFRDCCNACGADLHSCQNCAFHDPSAYNECRESNAERVPDRDRANRCDYFSPGDQVGGAGQGARSSTLSDLDALFKK